MLNTKSLIRRKKITPVQSDKEFEDRNIDENEKIIKNIENENIMKNIEPDIIKPDIIRPDIIRPDIIRPDIIRPDIIRPSIFTLPKKQESDNIYVENDDIFRQDNIIREGRIGNIFDAELKKEEDVIFDDQSNSYIIIDYDNQKKILKNEDILNFIFNQKDNELIKKYIFTINYNMVNKQFEFNLIVSKFTENIEIMIKLLNFINDYINNNEKDMMTENIDKLMVFYYQLIIFLFKNILQVSKYDKLKLAKYSSYLSYKYSTMILKKISNIEINNLIINNNLQSLLLIKKDLLTQLNEICSIQNLSLERHMSLNQNNTKNITEQILNRSVKYKLSSEDLQDNKQDLIEDNLENMTSDSNSKVNIMTMFTDSAAKSENKYNINNLMNFFSDNGSNYNKSNNNSNNSNNSDNSDNSNNSDDNNYQEVDITSDQNILITEDKLDIDEIKEELNKISNNSNIPLEMSNKDTVSENLYANNFESNKIKSSNIKSKSEYSYNTNSALLNSKLYELNL